jgi:hypothetical protein
LSPLAEDQREARGEYRCGQPAGYVAARTGVSLQEAQDEAGGHDVDVDDRHVLECPAVREVHHDVSGQGPQGHPWPGYRGGDEQGRQGAGVQQRPAQPEPAGRDRAVALDRMVAVQPAVGDVVRHVDEAGGEREEQRRPAGPQDHGG